MNITKHYNFKYHILGVISAVVLVGLNMYEQKFLLSALWFGLFLGYFLSRMGLTLSGDKFEYKPAPIRKRLFYPTSEIRGVQFIDNQIHILMGNGERVVLKRKWFSQGDLMEIDNYFAQFVKN